jgi:hypothetical protein
MRVGVVDHCLLRTANHTGIIPVFWPPTLPLAERESRQSQVAVLRWPSRASLARRHPVRIRSLADLDDWPVTGHVRNLITARWQLASEPNISHRGSPAGPTSSVTEAGSPPAPGATP